MIVISSPKALRHIIQFSAICQPKLVSNIDILVGPIVRHTKLRPDFANRQMAQKQLLLGIDTERSRHWLNKLNIEQRLVTPSAQGIEPVEFDRQWQRYVDMTEANRRCT